jgi:hypothetical protein
MGREGLPRPRLLRQMMPATVGGSPPGKQVFGLLA